MSVSTRITTALAAIVLALVSGCGGARGSYGVSPASFLIPGLDLHAQPASPHLLPTVPEASAR
ncbi:MAG: hypothetical protein J0L84_05240 [Verrucomicrobia bacterium]|nr:hypothetical protein [Verrucomicrobiota bacterium]